MTPWAESTLPPALTESELRLRQIADTLPTYIAYVDHDLRYRMANRMYEQQFGRSAGEIVGHDVAEVVGAAFATIEGHLRAALAGETRRFETRVRTVGGDRFLDVSHIPDRDPEGHVRGVIVHGLDVTERRRAEEALRLSDERLRMALQAASGVGTWDWDVVHDRVYADAGFARMYQVDVEQARTGIGIQEFQRNMHPEDVARVAQAIERTLQAGAESGVEFLEEYRLVQPDGSSRWVSAVGRCTYAPDGTPVRFPGVTFDITQRKQIEETLRASEERLRIAAETARLGTWELDLTTGRMVCSEICKQNFGRAEEDDFDYAELIASIHPDDLLATQMAVQAAVEGDRSYRAEYRAIWPDQSVHWILASGRVVSSQKGPPARMIGVTLDVTERHHAVQALMQSEKLAAVGRLASSIAHEINNPLESVMNLIYLARHEAVNPIAQQYLDTADQELRRVSIIANQTLRFHKQSTAPRHSTCLELIESVLSVYQGRVLNSGIAIAKRKRALSAVLCFDGEIRQVLNNLVGNAIDAMPSGGRLLLRSRETTAWQNGRRGLVLTVADTGVGMCAATIRRIFDPFFTTKGIGGTGLGLWVSKEIVDRHQGTLRVRSRQRVGDRPGGTVFALFLPFDGVQPSVRKSETPSAGD